MVAFIAIAEGMRRSSGSNYSAYQVLEAWAFLIAGALTWAAVGLYWWLLWRSSVNWTRRRNRGSAIARSLLPWPVPLSAQSAHLYFQLAVNPSERLSAACWQSFCG